MKTQKDTKPTHNQLFKKEEEKKYDKNNEKVSTPKIKLIYYFNDLFL